MDGMNTAFARQAPGIVVDAFHARDVPPTEAAEIMAAALEMTRRSLAVGIRRALDQLESPAALDAGTSLATPPAAADPDLAASVRQQRRSFPARFAEIYETIFNRRVDGGDRASPRATDQSVVLALVQHGEVDEQVALKKSIRAMHQAVLEEKFALDLRVRALMREAPGAGEFDNPWRVRYICDALGSVCRELWPEQNRWRPIMVNIVRLATPQVLNLYRELNAYLQDCNILPEVRVRTRRHGDRFRAERMAPEQLFSTLIRHFAGDAVEQGPELGVTDLAPVVSDETGIADPDSRAVGISADLPRQQTLNTLIQALASLRPRVAADQIAQGESANDSHAGTLDAAQSGPAIAQAPPVNMVRFAREGLLRRLDSPADQATVEVVAALIDCILCEPCLPDSVKIVFARLQVPLLKSALTDPAMLISARHPTRNFIDNLFRAMVGLRDDDPEASAMLQLAHQLADQINAGFGPERNAFAVAKPHLDRHLDGERALQEQRQAGSIADLLAKEARTDARERVQEILSVQLTSWRVPAGAQRLLTSEWLEHMVDKYLDGGAGSAAWNLELALIDDLMWSLSADAARDRSRLRRLVPRLVNSFSGGRTVDSVAEPWRKLMLEYMFTSYLDALRGSDRASTYAPLRFPLASSGQAESPPIDARVHGLVRGDWCEFRTAGQGEPVLARLSWRSPRRTQLLFTLRNGATAFVHTPASLSEEFSAERAVVALEDVPLFERAMRQLLVS